MSTSLVPPLAPAYIYESHLPILGICYGMQVLAKQLGGQVTPGIKREYGHAMLHLSEVDSPLFANLSSSSPVWMSHADKIEEMLPGFTTLAYTENSPIAVMGSDDKIFGLQFHPEVALTMPKFEFESGFRLRETLTALGMPDAFLWGVADFSGMTGNRDLFIADVIHKAFVSVDEAGTEAAAATAVVVPTAMPPGRSLSRLPLITPLSFSSATGQAPSCLLGG